MFQVLVLRKSKRRSLLELKDKAWLWTAYRRVKWDWTSCNKFMLFMWMAVEILKLMFQVLVLCKSKRRSLLELKDKAWLWTAYRRVKWDWPSCNKFMLFMWMAVEILKLMFQVLVLCKSKRRSLLELKDKAWLWTAYRRVKWDWTSCKKFMLYMWMADRLKFP